jgi:hypothetical protein
MNLATTLGGVKVKAQTTPILEVFGFEKGFSHIDASLVRLMLRIAMRSVDRSAKTKPNRNKNGPWYFLGHPVLKPPEHFISPWTALPDLGSTKSHPSKVSRHA